MDKCASAWERIWDCLEVSTLVLMDSWINAIEKGGGLFVWRAVSTLVLMDSWINATGGTKLTDNLRTVSTLVLMDSWINALYTKCIWRTVESFNPCFNGFMDKCGNNGLERTDWREVSTLVLMDSWINAQSLLHLRQWCTVVSTLVLMDSWINATTDGWGYKSSWRFQPLF